MPKTNSNSKRAGVAVDAIVRGYSEAVSEYFEWLTQAEIDEAECPEKDKARSEDCFASASSMLGTLLIKHGIYSANTQLTKSQEN